MPARAVNSFYGSWRLIYEEGGHNQILGITKIAMLTFLCFMQVQVKAEYIAIVFSYCSLTSMSPVGNHSLALQSHSAEKITYAHETLLKKKNHHHSEDGHPLDFLEAQETSVSSKEAPSLTEGGTGAANSKNLASQNFRQKPDTEAQSFH